MENMSISERELKLLMNFIKDDLKDAVEQKDTAQKDLKIEKVLEHIQSYLED